MKYKNSGKILAKIRNCKSVLLSCHRSPDPDSIAGCFAFQKALSYFGKISTVISPDPISKNFLFIGDTSGVKFVEKMDAYDFGKHDLWILLDVEKWEQAKLKKRPSSLEIINIDHHPDSFKDNSINIVDSKASSTTEILYYLFTDWGVPMTKELAQLLLTGLAYDTNFYMNLNTSSTSHRVTSELIDKGADNYSLVKNMEHSLELNQMYLWKELLNNLNVDQKLKFVWTSIPYKTYRLYPTTRSVTSVANESIFRRIDGTVFAIVMCETRPRHLTFSLRSREPWFDVSVIAGKLGGGGHKVAAGASIDGLEYEKAVEKVLQVARKYAKTQK